jgi:hypothetical protein
LSSAVDKAASGSTPLACNCAPVMAASTPVPSAVNATPRSLPIWLTAGAQGASVPKIRSVSASLANDHQLRSVGRSVSILRKSDGTTLSGAGSGA